MHDHDYEVIMALAEGTLDPAAAPTVRAEIEACAECAQDLELQVAGLNALREMRPAGLSELESARLNRNLRRELGIEAPRARPAVVRSRLPLAALGTAAAVLLAVILVGPGLNLIGGGGDSEDTAEIMAVTTAAPATTASPAAGADAAVPQESGSFTDELAGAPPSTTAAPAAGAGDTTTTARAVVDESDLFAYFREQKPDLEVLRDGLALNSFDVAALRSQLLRDTDDAILEEDAGAAAACIQLTITSADNFIEGFQLARGQIEGREVLIIVYLAEDLEESAVIAQAADNCEELDRAGP